MKQIPLTQGQHAIVDDEDYPELSEHKWYASKCCNGYNAVRNSKRNSNGKRRNVYMPREIMNAPSGKQVDHINHNQLDNRKRNLRICTHAENGRNRVLSKNNTSGYKGARWRHNRNKWQAEIYVNGKRIYLGLFNKILLAAETYDVAARKYHGEFANTNFKNREIR